MAQAATIPLGQQAATHARGMQPLTPITAGNFRQGDVLEQQIQLLPGKCYTALAVGAGISEMDIQLIALQPIPGVSNPVLSQDRTTGRNAVMAGAPNCYKWPWPFGINAKVVYRARAGSGVGAGRVYVR